MHGSVVVVQVTSPTSRLSSVRNRVAEIVPLRSSAAASAAHPNSSSGINDSRTNVACVMPISLKIVSLKEIAQ